MAYGSMADVDAKLVGNQAWDVADAQSKEAALDVASMYLDHVPNWKGCVCSPGQENAWPREGVVDDKGREVPVDEIPERVIKAFRALVVEEINGSSVTAAMADPERFTTSESVSAGPISSSESFGAFKHSRPWFASITPFQAVNLMISPYVERASGRLLRS